MRQYGFVYLLGNLWMPDLYKVGCTEKSPHLRAAQLSDHTGVPAPYHVLCHIEVEQCQRVEQELHELLAGYRVSTGREFFFVEYLPLIVSYFLWYPNALGFTDCGASDWLADRENGMTLGQCSNPWKPGGEPDPAPASRLLKIVGGRPL